MIANFFNKHKGVRRLIILWVVLLVTWGTYKIFSQLELANSATASSYVALLGIGGLAIALYKISRGKEDD